MHTSKLLKKSKLSLQPTEVLKTMLKKYKAENNDVNNFNSKKSTEKIPCKKFQQKHNKVC